MHIRDATPTDLPAVRQLLRDADLPLAGIPEDLKGFLVAERETIVGAIGLERYADAGLLRSAVVAPSARGSGIGEALVQALMSHAGAAGVRDLVLLTTTALDWFPRFGFTRITRAEAPESLHASAEFQGACPASAIVMRKRLA